MLKPTVSSQFPPFGGGPVRFKNNHLKLLWANIKTLCHIRTICEASSNQVPRHLVVYNLNYLIICHMISITQTGFK